MTEYSRKNRKRILQIVLLAAGVLCLLTAGAKPAHAARNYGKAKYNKTRWEWIRRDNVKTDVDRLIMVKYKGGSKATVEMWAKYEVLGKLKKGSGYTGPVTAWYRILSCPAYVGKNGINKVKEGDKKTPTGAFHITMAFGIKDSPGTSGISYTKLNKYLYWSGEKATYNTLVDVRDLGRKSMAGEHLITYVPFYNYSLAMDFNKGGVYKAGSAIFMHCWKPGRNFTAGCIAVSEENMKTVVQNTTEDTMIFIYKQ